MIDFDFENNCYGCKNCENICPTGAIKLVENEEGFFMPAINKNICINCGACEKKCPYINYKENNDIKKNTWYSCYLKDIKDRENSTSGGIFPAMSKYILENNGLICGCVWDDNMKPTHILTNDINDVNRMRGSKYLQSDMIDVIKKIKEQINDKLILFTGTPCQVAAVKLYIGDNPNLYTCGLICEGVPSYKVWEKYVKKLEKKYKAKMVEASFRNKEIGWDSPIARYKFSNGKIRKTLSFTYDRYVMGFLQGLYYRNSCSNCQYKGNGHNSDILIGDLWGANSEQLKETNYKGISAVILNSEKGQNLFKKIEKDFEYKEIVAEEVIKHNKLLMFPIEKNTNRDKFFKELDNMDIVKNIDKNIKISKVKSIGKEFLYKTKIFRTIKSVKMNSGGRKS